MSKASPLPVPALPSTTGLDLVELETFIAVATAESFSSAAQQLHVTQPTVTGRIQRLEAMLGAQLLKRTTRKVETTAQGALLLREATKTLAGLAQLVETMRQQARVSRRRVVIAATPTIAALRLPPIIQAYSARYPDVEVELLDLQYASVLAAIDEGRADVALLAYEGTDSAYRFQPLWSDDMLLVAPRGHPLAKKKSIGAEQLASVPLIVVDQYQAVRARISAALQQRGLTLPAAKVVGNLNTLLGMLEAGMGVTLLPRSVSGRGDVAKHARIEIEDVDLRRHFGILTLKRAKPGTATQSFSRFLRQEGLWQRS